MAQRIWFKNPDTISFMPLHVCMIVLNEQALSFQLGQIFISPFFKYFPWYSDKSHAGNSILWTNVHLSNRQMDTCQAVSKHEKGINHCVCGMYRKCVGSSWYNFLLSQPTASQHKSKAKLCAQEILPISIQKNKRPLALIRIRFLGRRYLKISRRRWPRGVDCHHKIESLVSEGSLPWYCIAF